jgi:multidrug resistance efflux pump
MRENNLGNLKPGDPAEVVLDVRPGQVFKAKVESVGWGVARSEISEVGDLPTIRSQQGWLREAQRFPLRLQFTGEKLPQGIRVGSQANIIVYTDGHPILNALGGLWIRLVSVLTYAY